uniref:Uncharacterized protein n=1 Tax=Leersia perrieri TaxID=77586 RepID=A0A0D9WR14_9ORYZ
MGGDLYALDFDGVLCDSCGESSLSAIKAAKVRWPWVFEQVDASMEEWIVEQMYTLRPVVETGYENLLLVRLLVEIRTPSVRKSSVADGLSIQEILENWLKLKPTIMSEWDEDRDSLVDLFGSIRDDWIENDLPGWIGANRFYPGTADALKFSSSEVYIVTTKQGRFAEALLKELAGIKFPSERIYGLGTGPKVKVLQQLQQMPQHQGLTLQPSSASVLFSWLNLHPGQSGWKCMETSGGELHWLMVVSCGQVNKKRLGTGRWWKKSKFDICLGFVEDRLATLKNVIKEPALDQWNLYLVNWGYNTQKEREKAEGISRIQVIDLPGFSQKLK